MTVFDQKKRQVFLALFLFVCSPFLLANVLCKATGELEKAKVKRVVDGDTLYLVDGRKVRLVGINAPELGHKQGKNEPYSVAATVRLRALAGQYIYLQVSKDQRDHYGRYLYYLFDKDRISLSSQLLSQGLGYRVAIPPNLAYQPCLMQAEEAARKAGLGVWKQSLTWHPRGGFVITQVVITSITHNRGGWWLETNQDLVINLPFVNSSATDVWPAQKVYFLQGHKVEVRGWQHQIKGRKSNDKSWILPVKHPNDLHDLGAVQ